MSIQIHIRKAFFLRRTQYLLYSSDRQFYIWHLVYLDRLFLMSNLMWRRAHVTAETLAGIQNVNVNVLQRFRWGQKALL